MFNDFSMLRALCPPLSRIWNKIRYLDEQVDRVPENTHIYIIYFLSVPYRYRSWPYMGYVFLFYCPKLLIKSKIEKKDTGFRALKKSPNFFVLDRRDRSR